jgi:hypothetical protein
MIRIYTDGTDCLELVVQDSSIDVSPIPIRLGTPTLRQPPQRRRSIGFVTAALLVAVAGGGGYLLAPRTPPAHAAPVASASLPSDLVVPRPPNLVRSTPETGPNAVARALANPPTVTAPPAARSTTPPGVAAFGLQP